MVDEVVRRLGLEGVFEVIQTAEGLERGKPDPEIYRRAATGLGLEASECVVMEDSSNGVKSGKAAGCHVIAVPNEDTRTQDFSAADFVAGGLREAGWRVRGLCAGA
jgi:beta-phosphoglucomutase-like phosphatase (HAD superfamily)